MDPTSLKRQKQRHALIPLPETTETESSKSKPSKMKDKRKKKQETKNLSGNRKNLLSSVGLVGLGAVCNYLGTQNQMCSVTFDQAELPTQSQIVLEEQKLVNIGDMYIQEGDNELSLEEIFNRYDIY